MTLSDLLGEREIWLRRRRKLSGDGIKVVSWVLEESWKAKYEGCIRVIEVHGEEAIRARQLHFSEDLQSFPVETQFRFFRLQGESKDLSTVNIDETSTGITLNFKIASEEFAMARTRCSGLEVADSKLKSVYFPVSEHLMGIRGDVVTNDDSEDNDSDCEAARDWINGVKAQAAKPFLEPDPNAKFTDDPNSFAVKARKKFNETCDRSVICPLCN
jgi:hypothetical protein